MLGPDVGQTRAGMQLRKPRDCGGMQDIGYRRPEAGCGMCAIGDAGLLIHDTEYKIQDSKDNVASTVINLHRTSCILHPVSCIPYPFSPGNSAVASASSIFYAARPMHMKVYIDGKFCDQQDAK